MQILCGCSGGESQADAANRRAFQYNTRSKQLHNPRAAEDILMNGLPLLARQEPGDHLLQMLSCVRQELGLIPSIPEIV